MVEFPAMNSTETQRRFLRAVDPLVKRVVADPTLDPAELADLEFTEVQRDAVSEGLSHNIGRVQELFDTLREASEKGVIDVVMGNIQAIAKSEGERMVDASFVPYILHEPREALEIMRMTSEIVDVCTEMVESGYEIEKVLAMFTGESVQDIQEI